jgi:hypothetical protein
MATILLGKTTSRYFAGSNFEIKRSKSEIWFDFGCFLKQADYFLNTKPLHAYFYFSTVFQWKRQPSFLVNGHPLAKAFYQ